MSNRIKWAVAWVGVLVACKSGPRDEAKGLQPSAESFQTACSTQCQWRRQMKAVSPDMIRSECERDCGSEWSLPLVREGSELVRYSQERVRVVGYWRAPQTVELRGGPKLILSGPLSLAEPPEEGSSVVVVGVFTSVESQPSLADVSTIAPTD